MAKKSKIEWTEDTWNPIAGCSIVSPGCHNCYAMRQAARFQSQPKYRGTIENGRWTGRVNFHTPSLSIPLRKAQPTMYFVNSMSDLFHYNVADEWIDQIFAVMALCGQHTFQVLTKRAERMQEHVSHPSFPIDVYAAMEQIADEHDIADFLFDSWPLPNVWLGVSVEDQQRANERIPLLLETPAAVRFLSCEPLLGPMQLTGICSNPTCFNALQYGPSWSPGTTIDWVIIGGESGPDARPCNIDWVGSIVDQCRSAGVHCFVKQLGANVEACDVIDAADHFPGPVKLVPAARPNARVLLNDSKGGNPSEWPTALRVREMPLRHSVHSAVSS